MTEAQFIAEATAALRAGTTPQNAARRVYAVCKRAAKAWGMKPEVECKLYSPVQSAKRGGLGHWYVNFEAGPYDWAVAVSMEGAGKVWVEPYYGRDLYFYSVEARS